VTQAVEHSAHLTALVADGLYLDCRGFQAEAQGTRLFPKRAIQNGIVDLGDSSTLAADQELAAMLRFRAITTQERVQGIEAMDESGVLEEFQGAVNGGRGGFFAVFRELGQDFVGPDGLVLTPDDLKDTPSQRGQVYLPRCAHLFRRRDRALNAARVVMRRSLSVYDSRHAALGFEPTLDAPPGGRYSGGLYCNSLADFANGGRAVADHSSCSAASNPMSTLGSKRSRVVASARVSAARPERSGEFLLSSSVA
jgi:hypothetical protein